MANEGVPAERVREYLRELKPEARGLLVREVERGNLKGAQVPGTELILDALRPGLRRAGQPPERIGNPGRLFFRPLEPFLVDGWPARELPGRLDRIALTRLWEWIGRDLAPDRAEAFSREASAALLTGDTARAEALACTFQDHVGRAIGREFPDLRDERIRRRALAQIALPRAAEDLQILHTALLHRDALDRIAGRLPAVITNLADEQLDNTLALLSRGVPSDLLPAALILVINRLATPWQLMRIPVRSAKSDVAARVAQSPLAPAVTLVLAELRCSIEELRAALGHGRRATAVALCKELHDAIRGLRSELDLPADSAWGRELASSRSRVSELLRSEMEATPAMLRRLLRPRPAAEIASGAALDPLDVEEAAERIELVGACRHYAGELAINQVAPQIHKALQTYFDTGAPALLDSLRASGAADRPFRQSQVEAAVRFAEKLFGPEYAALFARSAAIAAAGRQAAQA